MNPAYLNPFSSRGFGMYELMSVLIHGLLCLLAPNCDAKKQSKLKIEIVLYIYIYIYIRKRPYTKKSISALRDLQLKVVCMTFEEAIATKYLEDHHEQNCLMCV